MSAFEGYGARSLTSSSINLTFHLEILKAGAYKTKDAAQALTAASLQSLIRRSQCRLIHLDLGMNTMDDEEGLVDLLRLTPTLRALCIRFMPMVMPRLIRALTWDSRNLCPAMASAWFRGHDQLQTEDVVTMIKSRWRHVSNKHSLRWLSSDATLQQPLRESSYVLKCIEDGMILGRETR